MMVIVSRIAVALFVGAAPVVCGVRHGFDFRAGGGFLCGSVGSAALSRKTDAIFDNQKDRAFKKYWDAGLKAALRANPG